MAYCAHSTIVALLRNYREHVLAPWNGERIGLEFYPSTLQNFERVFRARDRIDDCQLQIEEQLTGLGGIDSQAILLAIITSLGAVGLVGGSLKKLDPERYSRRTTCKYMASVVWSADQFFIDQVRSDDGVLIDYCVFLDAVADWYLHVLKAIKVWMNT